MIELNEKQKLAVEIAVSRYNNREPWTCISGYAGSGKTTIIQHIIQKLKLKEDEVCYISFTGKAALVLKEKGCFNSMTAHRLLYKSHQRNNGTFFHTPRISIPDYKLIVVDEVSMLPKEMWDLLLTHNIHVIASGDPGQLPALFEACDVLDNPHIFLDEIMRQEADNEIIKLSMDIRAGIPLKLFKGKDVQVIDKKDLVSGMLVWADQVICAKNETRKEINEMIREYLYGEDAKKPLVEGDKVICLRNYWNQVSIIDDVLVNGSIGYVHGIHEEAKPHKLIDSFFWVNFLPDYYDNEVFAFKNLNLDGKLLKTGETTLNTENFKKIPKIYRPYEFDYGYCITCWKAQGSEYDKVLVFEENFPFKKEEHIKYLYSACTRARKKLIIVRK